MTALRWNWCISTAARLAAALVLITPVSRPAASQEIASEATCLYSSATDLTSDDHLCIKAASFNRDLCTAIAHVANANALPPDYLARLIWRESRFRADAVSPKGARGIAQFMPGTAELRGLNDSFDVVQALRASAEYLGELKARFGNLGLAAAAYNAGEQRLANFLNAGTLPLETRSYVLNITGHTVEEWKTSTSDFAQPLLDQRAPFLDACVTLAESRRLAAPTYKPEGVWAPWGVQLAASTTPDTARALFASAIVRLPSPLKDELPLIIPHRDRSFGFRPRYSARIGRQTRAEANDTCDQIKKNGGTCLVFKTQPL